jgi:hypothetical protein
VRTISVILALLIFVTGICLGQELPATSPSPERALNPNLPTIFVVGDSTANNHANGGLGWGDPFIQFFDANQVNVINRARGGRSSRTFITEGLWENVVS